MMGPIDYVVLGFEGNSFDGSILRELNSAVDKGIIRVIDLLFIMKDETGGIVEGEYEDQTQELRDSLGGLGQEDNMPLLSDSDVARIGEQMKVGTAAGVLVIEHLWARKLKRAIADAGGFLLADGRVHPELAEAAMQELQEAKS